MIVRDLQLVSWMVSFMAFLMMWYVDSSFFHCFWGFLGRKPPCLDAWFVSVGIGGAVHVSSIKFDMLLTIRSICSHMYCHWFMGSVKFGALEEVFMLYRPHGAWKTMEVLEELA
jgi:hypothetical protein